METHDIGEVIILEKGEWLQDAMKWQGYDLIPSNRIIYKEIPGTGGTSMELYAKRDSIIIEPNVSIITNKIQDHPEWFGVYGGIAPEDIAKYLKNDYEFKKLLTTPESFHKIPTAIGIINKAAGKEVISMYKKFFCLQDEIERTIQDSDYRKGIASSIRDFFEFEGKAMISATPLPMSHPMLKEQRFKRLTIIPNYDYKNDIELIVTNSFDLTLRNKIYSLSNSQCICIFINKTDTISKIVHTFKLADYKVFCSEESKEKLEKEGFSNVFSEIVYPLARVNLFTCKYNSGLDIKLDVRADILLLTNLSEAAYTMFDPLTQSIQVQGRFRNIFGDGKRYNSLTHITNINPALQIKSKEEISAEIEDYKSIYDFIIERIKSATEEKRVQTLHKEIKKIGYANFLDDKGGFNYFYMDNLYDEERVKLYYTDGFLLKMVYEDTGHFNVTYVPLFEPIDVDAIFRLKKEDKKPKQIHTLTGQLINLYRFKEETPSYEISPLLGIIKSAELGEFVINSYNKIGIMGVKAEVSDQKIYIDGFYQCNYKEDKIKAAVKKYDREIHRYLPNVIQDIENEFASTPKIEQEDMRMRLQAIYDKYDIDVEAKYTHIKDYFPSAKASKHKAPYIWTLNSFLPKTISNLHL